MQKRFLFILCCFLIIVTTVKAGQYEIKNSGDGSSNSISVQEDSSTTVKQGSSIEINNKIDAKAYTGNNDVSGNTNGDNKIVTGDSKVTVNGNNQGNSNKVNPKPTGTQPNPTAAPGTSGSQGGNANNSSSGSSSSNSGNQTGGIGGGEVRGLAATSGIDSLSLLSSIAGFICLVIGSALVSRRDQGR